MHLAGRFRSPRMTQITPELIQQAKSGQEAALAAVLAHMMPVIRSHAAAAVCPGLDLDDAVQEGIIGLFAAIRSYRSNEGTSFGTYAGRCVQNAIRTARRAAGRKKHGPLNQSVPLNEEDAAPGPEEIAIQNEQLQDTLQNIQTRLSAFEQAVLELFLNGYSYEQIGQALGRNPKSVENALSRLRRKLKEQRT